MAETAAKTGSCLCGRVRYEVTGPLRDVLACHCNQCRKSSGHFVAATSAMRSDVHLLSEETLNWFRSSDFASRAFCSICGSNMFWQRDGAENVAIMAGTLDGPTGLRISAHVFCESAGDYYRLDDGIPRHDRMGTDNPGHPD